MDGAVLQHDCFMKELQWKIGYTLSKLNII
jgi:hypothetical protein